jgi:hypothetical protein
MATPAIAWIAPLAMPYNGGVPPGHVGLTWSRSVVPLGLLAWRLYGFDLLKLPSACY